MRLKELESEIKELQSIIFLNESDRLHQIRKSKAEGEIRTRVVASEVAFTSLVSSRIKRASWVRPHRNIKRFIAARTWPAWV